MWYSNSWFISGMTIGKRVIVDSKVVGKNTILSLIIGGNYWWAVLLNSKPHLITDLRAAA